jgi:hypothetical protein
MLGTLVVHLQFLELESERLLEVYTAVIKVIYCPVAFSNGMHAITTLDGTVSLIWVSVDTWLRIHLQSL